MSKRKKGSKAHAPAPLSNFALNAARFLFLVALGISLYLAINAWKGGGIPGCGPESDCDKVLSSRWASVFGVPISLFALPVYVAAFACLFLKNIPWRFLAGIATTIVIMAAWFVGLQMFAVRAFCKFCMTAHLAGGIAAIILLRGAPLPGKLTFAPVAAAAAVSLVMITAQMLSRPPAPVQVSTVESSPAQAASAPSNSTTNSSAAPTAPTFTILQGQVTLDLTKVPVSGKLDAKHKFVKLFDYSCHHCRELHHLLEPVKKRYSNEVAIISLPMPLDAKCNPIMKSTPRAHENACEYAKLALAVFLADAGKFEEYSNWLFYPPLPPELSAARAQAARVVTQEKLNAALADPRIAQQLKQDSDIFVSTSRLAGKSTLPQLIFARGASVGGVSDARQLNKILFDALGLGAEQAPPSTQ
ncbi:MAG: vitamin K epoxide reductase family protein [Limisphaerales bacterium]